MATSAPADRAGLADRGRIVEGAVADLVVFDLATIADGATFQEPTRSPIGIHHVIVGGRPVLVDGRQLDEVRPGRVLLA
jgi:N-acyl-D-amino-acid deacylase